MQIPRDGRSVDAGEESAGAVADGEQDGTEDPAHGIGQGDGKETDVQEMSDKKVDLAENDEGREHNHHRRVGITGTAQRSRKDLIDAAADSEGGNGVQDKGP